MQEQSLAENSANNMDYYIINVVLELPIQA